MKHKMNMTERAARAEALAARLAEMLDYTHGVLRAEAHAGRIPYSGREEVNSALDAWYCHRADLDTLAINDLLS